MHQCQLWLTFLNNVNVHSSPTLLGTACMHWLMWVFQRSMCCGFRDTNADLGCNQYLFDFLLFFDLRHQQGIFLHSCSLDMLCFWTFVLCKPSRWLWCGENTSRSVLKQWDYHRQSCSPHSKSLQSTSSSVLMLTLNSSKSSSPSPHA